MRTDRLIDVLATNLAPTKRGRLWTALIWALVIGGLAAFLVMLATVGLRPDFAGGMPLGFMAPKLLFTLSLIGAGAVFLVRSMRPGQGSRKSFLLVFLPFLVVGSAGLITLALTGGNYTSCVRMMMGTRWQTCLLCIPLFAVIPFAALIWALRHGAPTNLRRTGAIAGLVAGALGATAYTFYCADDSLPFIAIWYGGSIALCAFIGAKLGPRLLRW
jgi:hypothetical protein